MNNPEIILQILKFILRGLLRDKAMGEHTPGEVKKLISAGKD